eukprot:2370159-Pyramimonas_sp.AAC.1
MKFWELEEHEVGYSWLQEFRMWPGNGVLGTRRARSGLQFAAGHSECGLGVEFWDRRPRSV